MRIFWKFLKKLRKIFLYKILRLKTHGVRVIVTDSKKIFLIKHPYDDFWTFPGGGIKKGENIFETAKREAKEEASLLLQGELKHLGRYLNNKNGKNDEVDIVVCNKWNSLMDEQRIIDKIEIQKRGWFEINNLPILSGPTSKRLKEYQNNDYSKEIRIW